MVTADEMFGQRPTTSEAPASTIAVATAIEVLSTVADDQTADLIERLALALVERDETLNATRALVVAAFARLHEQRVQILRLRTRLATVVHGQRQVRTVAP